MALEAFDRLFESIGGVPVDVFQGLPSNSVPLCLTSWENEKKSAKTTEKQLFLSGNAQMVYWDLNDEPATNYDVLKR